MKREGKGGRVQTGFEKLPLAICSPMFTHVHPFSYRGGKVGLQERRVLGERVNMGEQRQKQTT